MRSRQAVVAVVAVTAAVRRRARPPGETPLSGPRDVDDPDNARHA
jgi:hypothetical protein